jgi:hypothetical protein
MRRWVLPVTALAFLTTGWAAAGPMGDAETALRSAYGHYRAALFATNMGKPDVAAAELTAFQAAWAALQPQLAAAPQYDGDAALPATLSSVTKLAATASQSVADGHLEKAHATLEDIRGEIAGLHDRAGILGFSDRMNAYHAAMEDALSLAPDALATPAGMEKAAELAGLLDHFAADIAAHPAPEASSDSYQGLAQAFQASVKAFVDAVRAQDPAAVAKATGGLKPAYSKFFVAFG